MDERVSKLKELIANEDFAKELFGKQTAEEAQALLKDNGVEFTLDEVNQIGDGIRIIAKKQAEGGELSEADLESVSGGVDMSGLAEDVGETLVFIGVTFYEGIKNLPW